MVTTSQAAKTVGTESAPEAPAFFVAVMTAEILGHAHEAAFETVRDLLKGRAQQKAWTLAAFAKSGGDGLAAGFAEKVAEVLELEPADADALKTGFSAAFPQAVLAKTPEKLPAALANWLEKAAKRKGAVLAISLLPDEAAAALCAKAQLQNAGISREPLPNNADMPLAKRFVRLARKLKVAPPKIVVIAAGASTARAALEAGCQCVALPNEFTAHGDFSGCQLVLDQPGDIAAEELFDLLFPQMETSGKR